MSAVGCCFPGRFAKIRDNSVKLPVDGINRQLNNINRQLNTIISSAMGFLSSQEHSRTPLTWDIWLYLVFKA